MVLHHSQAGGALAPRKTHSLASLCDVLCFVSSLQGAFEWDVQLAAVLGDTFGLLAYRPLQREVVNCTMSGRDCLCLLPSGGPCHASHY